MSAFHKGARVSAPAQPEISYPQLLAFFIATARREHGKSNEQILADLPKALIAYDIAFEIKGGHP